ncbi:GNAT family N-acetyltransferase [Catellatospora tritici]|uniref:GNAT family N-acetyltransferase n=1 Tax=Catellatospora tritici TaxID=2851566 RepID=UPI001C2CF263|nr:GNAT family N-acetyltransferase [Catellatospora tritici]MBV1854240.1 GNAT family N-acetyltransferase [Catellatospora tritici]
MSDMVIREATEADVPHLSRVRYAAFPWYVASLSNQVNRWRTVTAATRTLRLLTEVDGVVVAVGVAGFNDHTSQPGAAVIHIVVDPAHRRRGIGSALHDRLEAHLRDIGARQVRGITEHDPGDHAFALARGYRPGARNRFSRIDTGTLPPRPPVPAGVELRTAAEVGPEAVFTLEHAAMLDLPGDVPYDGLGYADWLDRSWHNPDQLPDVGVVAVVDGVPASVTLVEGNRELGRAMTQTTSTLRAYRGRGLARLVKWESLRRAAQAGIHTAFTCNDYENAAMLAVNDWFGYEIFASEQAYLKEL